MIVAARITRICSLARLPEVNPVAEQNGGYVHAVSLDRLMSPSVILLEPGEPPDRQIGA